MKGFETGRFALGICALGALFTGCGAGVPVAPFTNVTAGVASAQRLSHGRSWMAEGLAQQDLLYVSNGDGIVNIYRYAKHTLAGTLIEFDQPMGECVDGKGDVYIADYEKNKLVEYAHGAATPMREVREQPYRPYACSVDAKTGDLAIANYSGGSHGGNLAVYHHAKGNPVFYTDSDLPFVTACAYDAYGDLLVAGLDGYSGYYSANFAYLPTKSKKLLSISLPGPSSGSYWYLVGGLSWDGKYWVVSDFSTLYEYSINVKAQRVGTTTVSGGGAGPIAIYGASGNKRGTQVVEASYGSKTNDVYYWKYPAGGEPIASFTHGLDRPFGVAISPAK